MIVAIDGVVGTWWNQGGIPRIYKEILPRVRRLAPEIELRVIMGGENYWRSDDLAGLVSSVPRIPPGWRPWRMWRRIGRTIDPLLEDTFWRGVKADVFHPTYYGTRPIKAPSFCFVYDMIVELFPESFDHQVWREVRERKETAVRNAKVVLCISRHTRQDLLQYYNVAPEKCKVVYPGGALRGNVSVPSRDGRGGKPFVLYVGDFWTPYKNFEFLLRSIGGSGVSAIRDLQLVVVSSRKPSPEEEARYTVSLEEDRLAFRTGVADADLAGLYSECAVVVCPSLYEGFGLPVLEALNYGTPVACARAGSLPEVGGEAVEYFDPMSVEDCCRALTRALAVGRSPSEVARRKTHASTFSWEQTAEAFVSAVNEVAR